MYANAFCVGTVRCRLDDVDESAVQNSTSSLRLMADRVLGPVRRLAVADAAFRPQLRRAAVVQPVSQRYLGLCSAIGYLTDAVWKLVYRAVALSAAPEHFTDHALLKLHGALFALQLFGFLIGAPTAGLLSFDMPIITGYVIIKWMVRAVRPLLLSAGRLTCVRAWVVYLLMIVGWPCAVVASISGSGLGFSYGTGVLVVRALDISVKAASILAQSLVTRCRAANAQTDELKFIIKVSICTSSCR